jgi:hypothetical protein
MSSGRISSRIEPTALTEISRSTPSSLKPKTFAREFSSLGEMR